MPGFLVRLLIAALGLGLASWIVPGLAIADGVTLLLAALLPGGRNAFVRPIRFVLTLPSTVATLSTATKSLTRWCKRSRKPADLSRRKISSRCSPSSANRCGVSLPDLRS